MKREGVPEGYRVIGHDRCHDCARCGCPTYCNDCGVCEKCGYVKPEHRTKESS